MTTFRKKNGFDLLTPPPGVEGKSTGMFHIYCTSVCMHNYGKKY